jgi:glycosyltransferase involved in cell wall biosynthesis
LIQPFVSVVVPAYNEENLIGDCLGSILASDYRNLEIIVVDDRSEDRTADIACEYNVRLVRRLSRGGIAAARNDGIAAAKGEITAFVDADCIVDKAWLTLLLSHYTDDKITGVGGLIKTRKSGIVASYRSFADRERWADRGDPVEIKYLPGGNSSYRTEVLRKVKGFDQAFAQPRGHEAFEMGYRLTKDGYRLFGEPKAIVWHSREDSLRNWFGSGFELGNSAVAFLSRYRIGEISEAQLPPMAFIVLLILLFSALVGLVPLFPVIGVVIAGSLVEVVRAAYRVGEAVVHYRNAKYIVMFPVEITVRALTYAGYARGILSICSRKVSRLLMWVSHCWCF